MNTLKKKVTITSIAATFATILSISASVAWFGRSDAILTNIPDEGISGAVLTSYFHTDEEYVGDGTKETPFVITRPIHYENLIWLHNNVPSFYKANNPEDTLDGKGYYFEIGHDLDGTGVKKVYAYDDDGKPILDEDGNPTYTNSLNLSCFSKEGKELIPLGSPQYPFIGELNGNNLEVSGFKVVSIDKTDNNEALEDIGIYGYVGPSGYVHNVYYSDFTIDTNGAAIHDETSYNLHTPHISGDEEIEDKFPYPCIGSLAGHIMTAESFENVYINNCTVEGTGNSEKAKLDNYSYYGVVETPTGGGRIGSGNNYDFTFSSQAVYDYMRANYENISSSPMRNRNTEYAGDYPTPEFAADNTTINPLNKGISYVPKALGMSSYNLVGDDPDDYSRPAHSGDAQGRSYEGYNYSLSTLGYAPLTDDSKSYRYKVVTESGATPDVSMVESTQSLTEALNVKATQEEYRRYFDSSDNNWKYYHLKTKDRGLIPFTFRLTSTHDFNTGNNPTNDCYMSSGTAVLFIDGVAVYTADLSLDSANNYVTKETTGSGWTARTRCHFHINFTADFNTTLTMGTHRVAFVCYENNNTNVDQARAAVFYCKNAGDSIRHNITQDFYNLRVTEHNLVIDENTADNTVFSLTTDTATGYGNLLSGLSEGYNINTYSTANTTAWDNNNRPIINQGDTNMTTLYGLDLNNIEDTKKYSLSSSAYNFEYDDGQAEKRYKIKYNDSGEIEYGENGLPKGYDDETGEVVTPTNASQVEYDGDIPVAIKMIVQDHDPMWVATMETTKTVKTHTIVDDNLDGICDVCEQEYINGQTTHEDKPIFIADDPILTESGYSADNIDVVGGGFQFSNGFVTIDGEDNRALTTPLTSSDIGTKWYATEHAANSIVLYLSNVGGLNDNDEMGDIEFDYTWTTAGGFVQSNFKSMVFKKGGTGTTGNNAGYVYMTNALSLENGDYSETSRGLLSTTVHMKLRRGIVHQCAYAALDADGNILCGYNAAGQEIGSSGDVSEAEIATYVLLVGVKNNITFLGINTRIEEIRFSYLAPDGFGGNFGSVEHRSIGQTVNNTIMNFYFLVPDNDKFRFTVSYSGPNNPSQFNRGVYTVTFDYYSTTNESLDVIFYLYDINLYRINCNGVQVATSGHETVQVASSNFLATT